jgi:UDP-2,4-diacetamido-2,4,6-trideoxy-beta-L-altropyranose hydrolase
MDPGNETSKAIRLLQGRGVAVDVVVGAANPHREEIARRCAQAGFEFHLQPSNMAELMAAADLAIGAGGTTTWERCCLGLPTLQLAIALNQEAPTRALAEAGLVTYAGRSLTEHSLLQALKNTEMLKEQSRRVAELVDGLGAGRVAAALLVSASMKILLRNAQADDVRLYFDWANDPAVRRQSFDSSPVAWPEHRAWFAQRLSDSVLLVAQDEAGVPVGQVRFERKGAWRVNYSAGAEFRGAGLGAKMLAMAIAELRRREPGARLQGEIKRDNAASRKVFAALGFRETSDTMFELDA